MNDKLRKDLEKLIAAYPELKNRQLVFNEHDFSFARNNNENDIPDCLQKEELQEIIKGHSPKVEARLSPVHGYGVFAKEDINEGEFIEECRLLKMTWRAHYPTDPTLKDYVWANKECTCIECRKHGAFQYLALGLGSIYNHSDTPNTNTRQNFKTGIMIIQAKQAITKGEEIFVSYGDKYFLIRDFWKNINKNKALEKAARNKKDQAAKNDE
jgi:SET domain-containing protein